MPTPLCETCQGQGRETCAIIAYRDRMLSTARAAQADFVVTPGPHGGNEDLAAKLQAATDADLASLPAEGKRRECTIFSA